MKSEHHLYKMIYICIYVKDITLRGGKSKQPINPSTEKQPCIDYVQTVYYTII